MPGGPWHALLQRCAGGSPGLFQGGADRPPGHGLLAGRHEVGAGQGELVCFFGLARWRIMKCFGDW